MRSAFALVTTVLLVVFTVSAEEIDQSQHLEHLKMMVSAISNHGPVIPQPESVNAEAAKTFNITARSFSFSPSSITVDQGDVVTLNVTAQDTTHGMLMETYIENGTNISAGQTHKFVFTATTAGTFGWVCSNPSCGDGHSSMTGTLIVRPMINPAPQVSQINPIRGTTAGGTSVTITGTNFLSSATVRFGTTPATNVVFNGSTSITAVAPAHAAGTVDITVTNGDGQSTTLTNAFTYAVPLSVSSVSPPSGPTSGATLITINGTGFQNGATVTIGGNSALAVTVIDGNTIAALTPLGPANDQVSIPMDVVVTNPDNTKVTATGVFHYTVPALAVSRVNPGISVPAGGGAISIGGTGFTTAVNTTVTIGGLPATNVHVVDAINLTVTAPPHAAGAVDLVVTVGSSSVTIRNALLYVPSPSRRRSARH